LDNAVQSQDNNSNIYNSEELKVYEEREYSEEEESYILSE
jgi:hypothetical protein